MWQQIPQPAVVKILLKFESTGLHKRVLCCYCGQLRMATTCPTSFIDDKALYHNAKMLVVCQTWDFSVSGVANVKHT